MRVLVVEDNKEFARLVTERLTRAGFDADQAKQVVDAERAVAALDYAAIILDLGLPDQDGLQFLRNLRLSGNITPVLIMTGRSSLEDRVTGLREGADDYLAKPFVMDELIARLHALLRRPGRRCDQLLCAGNVSLDTENHQVIVGDHIQLFRLREVTVLELLLRDKDRVVQRRVFENHLYGLTGEQESNAIDVYVHRLRKQLTEAEATVQIHTIRGVGYMLSEDKNAQSGP
jgi:two-component system response regulator TctD